jgi:hypothetical protein
MNNKYKRKKMLGIAAFAVVINILLIMQLVENRNKFSRFDSEKSVQISPIPNERLATLSLEPSRLSVKVNDTFTLQVNLTSKFPLAGADAILEFDPSIVSVEKTTSSNMFDLYPRLTYDNSSGRILITGITTKFPEDSSASRRIPKLPNFATLTMHAKKTGSTIIKFDYKPNSTTASTAVRAKDSKNILTHINNAKIRIQ